MAASREEKISKKSSKPVTEKIRSTAFEGAARRREISCCCRKSLERTRAERAVESMKATPPTSTTTARTPSVWAVRSMASWTFGAVWRSTSPRTATTEYPSACSSMLISKSVPIRSSWARAIWLPDINAVPAFGKPPVL
jgi:hypothetical protein